MNKLLVVTGPTASGKSLLAMEIAKKYDGEIICADSRTIYKGLDVGSAKPTELDQSKIRHYLLDLVRLNEKFSVYDFKKVAEDALNNVYKRHKLPIVVGGSGLYIDSLVFDYKFRNPREYPDESLDRKTLDELVKIAKQKYPKEIEKIDLKNRRRVEQLILKGPSKDDDRMKLKKGVRIICLCPKMPIIRQNITDRLDDMLSNGFIQEVESLRKKYGRDNPLLQTTGYRRVNEYLDKKISLDEMKRLIIKDNMDLARKQKTWFRRNPYIVWVENASQAEEIIESFLQS